MKTLRLAILNASILALAGCASTSEAPNPSEQSVVSEMLDYAIQFMGLATQAVQMLAR